MEKSQSEPGCSVEEGQAAREEAGAPSAGSLGQLGPRGRTPFDSLLLPAAGVGHCSQPEVLGARSSYPGGLSRPTGTEITRRPGDFFLPFCI